MARTWSPPRLRTLEADERRSSTWTELFFDLIFVVCISELAELLFHEISWVSLAAYAGLFIPVWWCWAGGTFYADRFTADDLSHRLIIALQMLAVAAMATTIHAGFGSQAAGFALCYCIVRATVIFNYLRVGWHHPQTRPFTYRYAAGFSLALLLWLASIWIPAPARYLVIAVALCIDLGTPRTASRWMGLFPLNNTHLPERFGLFTIILLGEAIFSIVMGYVKAGPGLEAAVTAGFGFLIVFAFWYVYFNSLEGTGINQRLLARTIWIYSHLPLLMSLAAIAVGVKFAILAAGRPFPAEQRWLLCGSFALSYALLGLLHRTATGRSCPLILQNKARLRWCAAALALLLGASCGALPAIAVCGLLALCGVVQAALEIAAAERHEKLLEFSAED